MAVKNISTRMKICGRTAKCTGGHSAVEQSGYISRETMFSEYDGKTYYPKYAEDLVHNEVLLPENAPEEYKDPKKLWNSVEMFEKKDDAQLARTWRIELPNNWTYKYAIMFLRELCKRLFVSKGMCVQFAIHDSENNQSQRNLHAHIMLTMPRTKSSILSLQERFLVLPEIHLIHCSRQESSNLMEWRFVKELAVL